MLLSKLHVAGSVGTPKRSLYLSNIPSAAGKGLLTGFASMPVPPYIFASESRFHSSAAWWLQITGPFVTRMPGVGTRPGVVVEGVRREGGVHERAAAAGAASEHHLNGARDGVLRVNQQGPLQLGYNLLHARAEGHLRVWADRRLAAQPRQGTASCRL